MESAWEHFELGVELWEKGGDNREKAAEELIAAARLNPLNAAAFRYLGDYYNTDEDNTNKKKSIKCYERAVTVDPQDSHSGNALCDLLERQGNHSVAASVCRRASAGSPRALWALRRLGFILVHRGDWLDSLPCLQQAIRGFPKCPLLWEALGLAYHRLSRFTAALKSYAKAIDLDPSALLPLVQTGNLYITLSAFHKAIEVFRQAVLLSPKCVSASYGLASALLGHANQQVALGAFEWAAQLLEEATEVGRATTLLASNASCSWKLLGDIQLAYAKCYPWSEPSEVSAEALKESVVSWTQTCFLAATSARRSYQRALLLGPNQPNIYVDIAIASHLIQSFTCSSSDNHSHAWQLPQKMALASLLFEPHNHDFWVALGYLSHHAAMKQHAFIRGLHLDVSLAVAWAYMGKLYGRKDEKLLARQAFDCSRSIDPSLALPWAGMSAYFLTGEPSPDEAFESCLRAVQTLPLAEFQIGLVKLAAVSGHLSSPQVFGAIRQAVLRSPHFAEAHNLKGLVFEARFDYHSAAASYRFARCAVTSFSSTVSNSQLKDISVNLARSLSKAGNDIDAVRECENLKAKGFLDADGLQIYALSLWRLGQTNLAISVAKSLASSVLKMEHSLAAASVSLICRLLYRISGLDSSVHSISKMPKELFQSSRISFIVSAINVLDRNNRLQSVVSSSRDHIKSQEDIIKMHFLIALGKLLKSATGCSLGFISGVAHLRKICHMYPNSYLLRNLMGYLIMCGGGWNGAHLGIRCCSGDGSIIGLKSAHEIIGGGGVACYSLCTSSPSFSFPTCTFQCSNEPRVIQRLQKFLHREPWNKSARYLLILNLLQKAREERFPYNLCAMLDRLIHVAISNECHSEIDTSSRYQKFVLLLCASEISLQGGKRDDCIVHAKKAAMITLPESHLFFAHLILCRAYGSYGDIANMRKEHTRCLELKTDCHIGWICLKIVEYQYGVQNISDISELELSEYLVEGTEMWNMWMAIYNLVEGLISLWKQDFESAEEFLRRGCALASSESCLQLCHGVSCLELVKQRGSSELLSRAIRSLNKAQEASDIPLPYVSSLLARAHGSLGSKAKWKHNLRLEWNTWPPEMRPAELFFLMHLLAKQEDPSGIECCQTPQKWVLRAIHTNPSCTRYWKILNKLGD